MGDPEFPPVVRTDQRGFFQKGGAENVNVKTALLFLETVSIDIFNPLVPFL